MMMTEKAAQRDEGKTSLATSGESVLCNRFGFRRGLTLDLRVDIKRLKILGIEFAVGGEDVDARELAVERHPGCMSCSCVCRTVVVYSGSLENGNVVGCVAQVAVCNEQE